MIKEIYTMQYIQFKMLWEFIVVSVLIMWLFIQNNGM